eukprot:7858373-Heterocapsa_arctica.AAC.1
MDNYYIGKDDGKGIVHTRNEYIKYLNSIGRKPWTKATRPDWMPANEVDELLEKNERNKDDQEKGIEEVGVIITPEKMNV